MIPSASALYPETECSTDAVFGANSCDQCFDWGQKWIGDNIAELDDLWVNISDTPRIFFEREQADPTMKALWGSVWSQTPSADNFWKYTDDVKALYSESEDWYILEAWESVTFIESDLGKSYKLDSTDATQGENAGLLIFPLLSHSMLDDGDLSLDDEVHRECVLFKSAAAAEVTPTPTPEDPTPTPVTPAPQEMAKVETGAEAYLILLFALILGFVYIKTRKTA